MEKINWKKCIISLVLFILSIIMLMPFVIMISTSLKSAAEISSDAGGLLPKKLMFENYVKAMSTGMWARWFFNSVFITIIVTVVSLFFNSLAGYAFARLDFKFKYVIFLTLMCGLMVPPQITMVPVFTIIKHIPFAGGNNILGQGGTGWIDTYPGLMLFHLAGAYGVFLCRQFYLNFPKALDEAAEIDGCSIPRTYFQIYLPLSKPLLASLGVIKLTTVWNDYVWPLIMTNSEKMRTVQLALTIFKNEVIQWELLMAATTVITIPLIIIFLFAQRFFITGLVTSGIKG